jgi:methylmalonyl-CoA/ethylmalonyl-CoA epimerase
MTIDHVAIVVKDLDATIAAVHADARLPRVYRETSPIKASRPSGCRPAIRSSNCCAARRRFADRPFPRRRGDQAAPHRVSRRRYRNAKLAELKAKGVRLIDEHPRKGAHGNLIAFLHPKSTGGVLIELCQREN